MFTNLNAQKQNNIWAFGFRDGLDFNSGSPVAIQTAMGTGGHLNYEGSATVSDRYTGQLLFYSQGEVVWDRTHTIMPNGQNLSSDPYAWNATQAALIIPVLSNPDQYYLFSMGQTAIAPAIGMYPAPNAAVLSYSVVDMTLNGGLGDIVPGRKNIRVDSNLSELMIAVAGDDCNIWLLAHDKSNVFKAYEITAGGVINPPVLSTTGIGVHPPPANNSLEALPIAKVSPDRKKISVVYRSHRIAYNTAELYDFNPATGVVSNPVGLNFQFTNVGILGTCFSPDNSKLYFQELAGLGGTNTRIYQFDLNAGNTAAIQASGQVVGLNPYRGGDMQLGPDGRIYLAGVVDGGSSLSPMGFSTTGRIYVINDPDQLGTACQFQSTPLFPAIIDSVSYGLPNMVVYPEADTVYTTTSICQPAGMIRLGAPKGFLNYEWHDGSTDTVLTVQGTGAYWVRSRTHCELRVDTFIVVPNPVQADLGADINGCAGDTVLLHSANSYTGAAYEWSTGSTASSIHVTQSGSYWLRINVGGCTAIDTVNVVFHDYPVVSLGNDTGVCDADVPYTLHNGVPESGVSYLWSNGLSDTAMGITKTGRYWLELSRYGCVSSDTIYVEVVPAPAVYIGADSIICEQYPHRIGTEIPGALYLWSTGATTPYIEVSTSDAYVLEVNLRGCRVRDTVSINAMPPPDIDLGPDRDICPGETLVLNGSYSAGSSYAWNTGATTPSVSVSSAGTYSVTVTSEHGCAGSDTIVLSFYPKPVVMLGADTIVCEETPLSLVPYVQNADSVRWSDGSAGNSLTVKYADTYIVTGINKCGAESDTIEVRQIFCDIWLPNAFTPNGDGSNDVFRVLGNTGRLEGFGLSIYSRWGERVYYSEDKYKGWDGLYKGVPGQLGTYVYLLQYSIGGVPYQQQGSFHLLR